VRDAASRELAKLGTRAEGELRRALDGKPTLEFRQRAEKLLHAMEPYPSTSEEQRHRRAVHVLERLATAQTHELLKTLAGGAADAQQSRDAKAALERIEQRRTQSD
jgi:hypothetical protein